MSDDFGQTHPLSLRFADPALEASFAEEQARKAAPVKRMAAVLGVAIMAFWAAVEALFPMAPGGRGRFLLLVGILPIYVLGYAYSYARSFLRYQQGVTVTGLCLVSVALTAVTSRVLPEMFAGLLSIVSMHTIAIYTAIRLRFPAASVGGWFTLAIFLGYLGSAGAPGPALMRIGALLAVANALGMFACYQMDLYVRREFMAMRLRERSQADARRARDQAEAATRAKSEFLANMSHELRTPLNAIIGFSEVLGDRMFGDLNEKQEECARDIHDSGRHLLSLINDILDLSKIEAGRMELDVTTFDFPVAIDSAMALVRERAERHGLGLDCDVDGGLGAFRGDERKFKQILLNLLSNAVKFTPPGGTITVTARARTAGVEVAVADTGTGMAPDDLPRVFEEFRQVGADPGKRAEGTGLGLTLTKRFVELHGGAVRVESALGKGSTFTFTLAEQA
ncbi:MAG: HAMP domain-containing histidine kinase [Candidatus Rokubacteria bacterium]|nr:HAMP domain-containing histidine kinase [Candidatus Rokubacteria bacterium]